MGGPIARYVIIVAQPKINTKDQIMVPKCLLRRPYPRVGSEVGKVWIVGKVTWT